MVVGVVRDMDMAVRAEAGMAGTAIIPARLSAEFLVVWHSGPWAVRF